MDNTPQTGDASRPALYGLLLLGSSAGIVGACVFGRKKHTQESATRSSGRRDAVASLSTHPGKNPSDLMHLSLRQSPPKRCLGGDF
ncbi:MAG: sortase B protein-sorting domain-containing protein [Christensenellales bacterium]